MPAEDLANHARDSLLADHLSDHSADHGHDQRVLDEVDRDVKSEEDNLTFDFTIQLTGPLA